MKHAFLFFFMLLLPSACFTTSTKSNTEGESMDSNDEPCTGILCSKDTGTDTQGCKGAACMADTDTEKRKDTDTGESEMPITYDTAVDPNASFTFDFSGLPFVGVNTSGPEWDGGATGSKWPNPFLSDGYDSYSAFFKGFGMTTIRLPFKWEYLQPKQGEPFDDVEFEALKATVFHLKNNGANVLIDMHNYGRYNERLIGSDDVSYDNFADAWTRLANEFKDYPQVMFDIMNEPHSMSTRQWVEAANVAIRAIRDAGARNLIFVNGNGWSGAHSWAKPWTDYPNEDEEATTNAEAMLLIEDPLGDGALVFEVHQYLNQTSSDWGECECNDSEESEGCTSETVGTFRVKTFTDWLRANNKRGFLGEFGVMDDPTCLTAADGMLNYLEENDDVWVGWAWWAAGPGCSSWQMPIDPYCWSDDRLTDLKVNGVKGALVYNQIKLLHQHLTHN